MCQTQAPNSWLDNVVPSSSNKFTRKSTTDNWHRKGSDESDLRDRSTTDESDWSNYPGMEDLEAPKPYLRSADNPAASRLGGQQRTGSSTKDWLDAGRLEALREVVASISLTETSAKTRAHKACVEQLERIARQQFGPRFTVMPFGGTANGFGTMDGDLDVVLFCIDSLEQPAWQSQRTLRELERRLRLTENFYVKEAILQARVPILKLRFQEELEVDISAHNITPLKNTALLRAYASLHPIVVEVGVYVKQWAKKKGVSGAPQRCLSSYAWLILVIFYMQTDEDIQLPVLQTEEFGVDGSWHGTKPPFTCTLDLSTALQGFFAFYSQEFRWESDVASIRVGQRKKFNEDNVLFRNLRRCRTNIFIEDPFIMGRNLGDVVNSLAATRQALREGLEEIKTGQIPPFMRSRQTYYSSDLAQYHRHLGGGGMHQTLLAWRTSQMPTAPGGAKGMPGPGLHP
mmetsp:Transcript_49011/g.105507  ORF Transcript_49011/g.105507 Transcript_49011/m.105507 type:complete len:458 (+) Transcript_49011:257-1630(+)